MRRLHQPGNPEPQSILVVLPTWVGDFVMATPTLRAMRRLFSGAHIVFLAEPNLQDLIRGGNWMNECIEWPPRARRSMLKREYRDLIWELRRKRFDWAVVLPNSFRAALIARLSGAKRRIGYNRDGRGWLLTDRLAVPNARSRCVSGNRTARVGRFEPMPLVEYYADLAEAIGCERPGHRFELFTTPDCDESVQGRLVTLGIADHRPLVVVSPGAKFGASKCWMPERFASVADGLIETEQAAVVVTCGPGEEPIAREIGLRMRRGGIVLDDPRLSLAELKSLIRRSDLLICNDAGPRHIAKAFGVSVVTIFGPTHPEWTATDYEAERIVRVDVDCGPCQQRVCPLGHVQCMTGVSVEMVAGAAGELLRAHRGTRAADRGNISAPAVWAWHAGDAGGHARASGLGVEPETC